MKNRTPFYAIMGIFLIVLSLFLFSSPSLAEKSKPSKAIFYVW